jgi:hypothetical protein
VRNLLRLIDAQPGFTYVVGVVAVLATRNNQRLGDLAAGTVVVREKGAEATRRRPAHPAAEHLSGADLSAWDVTRVSAEDIVTVRHFLERRAELTPEARTRLARDFALRLRSKVAGAPEGLDPEAFLERLAAAKAAST